METTTSGVAQAEGRAILRIALPGALVDGGRGDGEARPLRALPSRLARSARPLAGVTEETLVDAAEAFLAGSGARSVAFEAAVGASSADRLRSE